MTQPMPVSFTVNGERVEAHVLPRLNLADFLRDQLGLTGTPSYVVGDEVVVGAVGFEALKSHVDAVRRCGRAVC